MVDSFLRTSHAPNGRRPDLPCRFCAASPRGSTSTTRGLALSLTRPRPRQRAARFALWKTRQTASDNGERSRALRKLTCQ